MTTPPMLMTTGQFVSGLIVHVPEASELVGEHLDDNGQEVILHLLMADLLRFAVRTYHEQRREVTARLLEFVDGALRNGDPAVENAVAVSFVEHVGAFPEETPDFIATWPAGLLAQRDHQRR